MDGVMVPGTAQIRKIGAQYSSEELMKLCAEMASGGYEKKLFRNESLSFFINY